MKSDKRIPTDIYSMTSFHLPASRKNVPEQEEKQMKNKDDTPQTKLNYFAAPGKANNIQII